jgi:Protein of unknown function (DUF1822)
MSLDLLLNLSETEQQQIWQQSQAFVIPTDRWNAYLNHLCLEALLPWLRETTSQLRVWPNLTAMPSFWTFVNGTAVTLGDLRIVLVPMEAIDQAELRVPQEWVDLPSWAADYYFAVQVEPDEQAARVWGYASHAQLKTQGEYNPDDRTYSLGEDDLVSDPNVLWLSRQLGIAEPSRAAIVPVPSIGLEQAQNLINRLANPTVVTPRLAVPFVLWGALLEHGGWRQRLHEQRQGMPEQRSLLQWLQTGISSIAEQVGWSQLEIQPAMVGARGSESGTPTLVLSRPLTIAGQGYELKIVPVGNPPDLMWRFELRSTAPGGLVPGGFMLRLLTEDLQTFEGNESISTSAVESLWIEVILAAGEGIVWEVEPVPEGFDREILRF